MICKRKTVCVSFVAVFSVLLCLVYFYKTSPILDEDVVVEDNDFGPRKPSSHRRLATVFHFNETACKALEQRLKLGPSRYVLGLNYWEQTNMALGSMFALERVAVDWNARLVRPFTLNSRLFGLPHLRIDHLWDDHAQCHALDLLFDLPHMDLLGCSYNLPRAANFKDFLRNGSRQLTVLHFVHDTESREVPVLGGQDGRVLKSRLQKEHVFECSKSPPIQGLIVSILNSLNSETQQGTSAPFILGKYYCINASIHTSPADLARKSGFEKWTTDASIFVLNWRGLRVSDVVLKSAKGHHKNNRLPLTNLTHGWHPTPITNYFKHSDLVSQTVDHFMADLSLSPKSFIGIHIRSEKLGIRESRIPNYTVDCLTKAIKVRNRLAKQHGGKDTMIFMDYGKYGSDSCEDCKGARTTKNFLSTYGMLTTQFNPTQHNAMVDSGFVAAVEMDTLATANYLILVGGGAFQKQLGISFRSKMSNVEGGRHKHRIHMVCWDDLAKAKPFKFQVAS